MTDLTNKIDNLIKTDVDSIQQLINKYVSVLGTIKIPNDVPYIAYLINESEVFLNEKHGDLPPDWKAWSVVVVKRYYLTSDRNLNNDEDIPKIIDEFILHYKSDYVKYCENIIAPTEYDRDSGFVINYLRKKGVVK